jgi:FKBP-type peptidyl-prolyl cis-trans isomerase
MGTEKRQRQKEGRQARVAAAEKARRKADGRKRLFTFVGLAAAVVLLIVGFTVIRKNDPKKVDASAATTTPSTAATSTTAALASAAGKPCVATADPLPTGAPAVAVEVGPPPTTLIIKDLKEGTGAVVAVTDTVTVNYIGVACSTGAIFDSSYKTGSPATFPLNGVIPGWTKGIPGMKVGGQRLLGIPSADAYGAKGSPPKIAPDEALWFVVDVTAATPATATTTAAK